MKAGKNQEKKKEKNRKKIVIFKITIQDKRLNFVDIKNIYLTNFIKNYFSDKKLPLKVFANLIYIDHFLINIFDSFSNHLFFDLPKFSFTS